MTEKIPYNPDDYQLQRHTDHLFEIIHENGVCELEMRERDESFYIGWMETHPRGQGVGQNMLRRIIETARELGLKAIAADIISREALEASRRIFGEEALRIVREGNYGEPPGKEEDYPEWHTSARLDYRLPDTPNPEG